MTYNWNTMVEIAVPTGTNGWLYSGEVIINGVKVRFPVGVPTSVPEPAAVLLKKMIELEQEEDANTAKPQNHYVGDVTIPAGNTLTLEKGAKFVDNSGGSASAGGGGKFIVTATMGGVKDEAAGTMEVTFDKTHLDAKTAHENGQNVFCIFDIGLAFDGADNAGDYCYFPVLTYNVNTNQIVFGAYINGMSFTVGMHSDPSLDFLEIKIPQV